MAMKARELALAVVVGSAVFLLLDAAWLSVMGARLYRPAIGHIMREDFDVFAAVVFYVLYLAGVMVFVVVPAQSGRAALLRGTFFGLVCYATYDLTSQAVVAGWPCYLTGIDLAWGAFATGASAWAAQRAGRARCD